MPKTKPAVRPPKRHPDDSKRILVGTHSQVFYFGGYNDKVSNLTRMVNLARNDFPDADIRLKDVTYGTVRGSGTMDGFACIVFQLPGWQGKKLTEAARQRLKEMGFFLAESLGFNY